jgi:segregation and condensation protein A
LHLELAGEYLVMAATLTEIKSRMLLPKPVIDGEEQDPRAELMARLREYERIKQAAEDLDNLPRMNRDFFVVAIEAAAFKTKPPLPQLDLNELLAALKDVMQRATFYSHHFVRHDTLSIREQMSLILQKLQSNKFAEFADLFPEKQGKLGVVVTFIAILELIKQSMIEVVQTQPYSKIYLNMITRSES